MPDSHARLARPAGDHQRNKHGGQGIPAEGSPDPPPFRGTSPPRWYEWADAHDKEGDSNAGEKEQDQERNAQEERRPEDDGCSAKACGPQEAGGQEGHDPEEDGEPAGRAAKKATTRRKTAARRKPAAEKATTRRKTAARRKPAAKKATTRRKTAARRKPAAKKATTRRKTAARRKPAAKKATTRRKTAPAGSGGQATEQLGAPLSSSSRAHRLVADPSLIRDDPSAPPADDGGG